jgi:anthranilate phosphoribosyltransferase (EC 2.4.2.18)
MHVRACTRFAPRRVSFAVPDLMFGMAQAPPAADTESWPLKRLMTEVVGTGIKSAQDLTRPQATAAMRQILAGEPDHTTLGAFWLANRWKHNTPAELAAYADVMMEQTQVASPEVDPVDCGANYDGKGRTAILGVIAGLIAAGAGTPVVVHSGDRVPTQKQDAYKHVLDALGVRTELQPEESARMTDAVGFGFYYQPAFAPHIAALTDRRDQMGVRTFLNTIETIANPAGASVHLGSFYHLAFAKKIVDTFAAMEHPTPRRVLMFQGMEGYDDIRPGYTTVGESTDGAFTDYAIEPDSYGLMFTEEDLRVDETDVAGASAALTEAILTGEAAGPVRDAALLNAALRIYAREDAPSIEAGLESARESLEGGAAAAVLESARAF